MSADDRYHIDYDPERGYVCQHRFVSAEDDGAYTDDPAKMEGRVFYTLREAILFCQNDWTEYGYTIGSAAIAKADVL